MSDSLKKARSARSVSVRAGDYAVQGRMQIPKTLAEVWAGQSSKERGNCWTIGNAIESELPSLMGAIAVISGEGFPKIETVSSGVTVSVGEYSASADTQAKAALELLREVLKDKVI